MAIDEDLIKTALIFNQQPELLWSLERSRKGDADPLPLLRVDRVIVFRGVNAGMNCGAVPVDGCAAGVVSGVELPRVPRKGEDLRLWGLSGGGYGTDETNKQG
jgi:hypothetical protein